MIFDHLGYRRPTVHPVRVIECAELLAAELFTAAEQTRAHTTFGTASVTWPSWPIITATVAVAAMCWHLDR